MQFRVKKLRGVFDGEKCEDLFAMFVHLPPFRRALAQISAQQISFLLAAAAAAPFQVRKVPLWISPHALSPSPRKMRASSKTELAQVCRYGEICQFLLHNYEPVISSFINKP